MKTNMKISSAKFAGSSTQVTQKPARKLPEFAFIGRSNVGKSSLINMLCGNGKLAMTSGTPGKIDMDFLNELGDSDIPFAIIFTKGDKLGPVARAAKLERDKEQLGEFWEELPLSFVSSSNSGLGKEEILGYIGSVLEDLKNKDEAEQTK